MTFKVGAPVNNPSKLSYTFTIEDAPIFDCSSFERIAFDTTPHLQNQLRDFIDAFIQQATPYFSKPLKTDVFFHRLSHVWCPTELVDSPPPEKSILRAQWIPAHICFYANRYEIKWIVSDLETQDVPLAPSLIPPGFMDMIEATELSSAEGVGGAAEAHMSEAIEAELIPFSASRGTEESAARERGRQRIRQARLRAALAQLKAERLAEQYYARYGTFEGMEGSDSELSEEGEEEGS